MLKNVIKIKSFLRNHRTYASTKEHASESDPIKFSASSASKRVLRPVRSINNTMPWYQPYSVVASVSIFLIYFCILREENDIDLEFNKTLFDRIEGLEKQQLIQSYKFNKEHGKSVEEIEKRLAELESQDQATAL